MQITIKLNPELEKIIADFILKHGVNGIKSLNIDNLIAQKDALEAEIKELEKRKAESKPVKKPVDIGQKTIDEIEKIVEDKKKEKKPQVIRGWRISVGKDDRYYASKVINGKTQRMLVGHDCSENVIIEKEKNFLEPTYVCGWRINFNKNKYYGSKRINGKNVNLYIGESCTNEAVLEKEKAYYAKHGIK